MLPTQPQPDAAGATAMGATAGEMEEFGEPIEFHNWAGKGAEDLVLPEIKENSDDSDGDSS